ncbi:MAG: hypothetical protein IKZ87_00240 [Actinomycetaceae bacterium]|nr:hypothetical protein [Actinomycetaceae bacterium]
MIHIVTGKDMAAVEAFIKNIKTPSTHVITKMVPDRHHTELPEYVAGIIKAHENLIIHTFSYEILHLIHFLANPEEGKNKPGDLNLSLNDVELTRVTVKDGKTHFTELNGEEFSIAVCGDMECR